MAEARPKGHISALAAWAFAFGCAVGWDSFVLPWTTFLPKAGPLGTVAGLLSGVFVMAVVAWNYHFMMNRSPGPGGVYQYASSAFGIDHGFLCAWFLSIVYVSITWMDAAVLAYFMQHAWGVGAGFGFEYVVAGYKVGPGQIMISAAAIALAAAICTRRRLSAMVQTVLAVLFVAGVAACFAAAFKAHAGGLKSMAPAFAPGGQRPFAQVLGIVAVTPWLFIGFEAISHSSGEFRFPQRRAFGVMAAALLTALAAYVLLAMIPALVPGLVPGAPADWPAAVSGLAEPNDTAFATASRAFATNNRLGLLVTTVTFFAAIFTNLVGNTVAASRLLAAMADDGSLPRWFGRRNADGAPGNAVLAIACVSVFVFALGETVIGIVVDLAIVGAALAYAYTSAATFKIARAEGSRLSMATGACGLVLSGVIALLYLMPVFSSNTTMMGTESYFMLVLWCIVGLLLFLFVFRRDRARRFGRSIVVWTSLFVTILVLSQMWMRQTTYDTTEKAFDEIVRRHEKTCVPSDHGVAEADGEWRQTLRRNLSIVNKSIVRNSFVQTGLNLLALGLMLCLYAIMRRRERELEREKMKSRSYFFSSVSHDIRTPLNAIIGFSEVLRSGDTTEAEREQALESIAVSGKTLLGLVNDVLDLSKLENGKMEISPEPTDCPRLLGEIMDAFRVSAKDPSLELRCRVGGMPPLMLDQQRLRQIVFNLVGNAVKFTERGHIELRAEYRRRGGEAAGELTVEVEDTGCGISEEDLKRIGSAYVQVGAKQAHNGGTGLGLAICRQLAAAMGGRLEIASALGKGSTFSLALPGVKEAPESPAAAPAPVAAHGEGRPSGRLLLVDDSKMNLMVLKALLGRIGDFDIATACDGKQALDALRSPGPRPFDIVFTDMWMPNLDGDALVKAVRADPALSSLKVVVVTADVELGASAAESLFDGFLLKPVTAEKLLETIRAVRPTR